VLGRIFLGPRRLARLRGDRAIWELAEALLPAGRAYDYNQALMDFGATWCTPRAPRCPRCSMKSFCRTAEVEASGVPGGAVLRGMARGRKGGGSGGRA
jgi:A/G-specific adenine glycosylase